MKSISWVEKYRPKNLNEITSQKEVISSLRKSIDTKNIPHLIFFGPSGCGKTSTILALAEDLFGKDFYSDRIIELNASDERGINIIRDKIKMFAKRAVRLNKDVPPWKIIILDEADSMTSDSQFALRRIIEEYSKVTRFCIICNYHNKIIDPIVSRCSLFRFKPIKKTEIIKKLNVICEKENMICSNDILKKIVKLCRGDLRKAINFLQRCKNTFGDKITNTLLDEISGIIPKKKLKEFLTICKNNDNKKLDEIINEFFINGYSLVNQILPIHDLIIKDKDFKSHIKSQIIIKLAEIDQYLIKGCDEYIQFLKLGYYILVLFNQ